MPIYTASKKSTLLEFLATIFPDSSKRTLLQLISSKRVRKDSTILTDPRTPIAPKDAIEITKKEKIIEGDIKILFEDRHLIVIDKPEGLLSVATEHETEPSAHSILKEYARPKRVFPVHRLDRETSGVMLFAYSKEIKEAFQQQFITKTISRTYRALLEGHLTPSKGTWKDLLWEDAHYHVHASTTKGKQAITHYHVLSKKKKTTLIELNLETGRKNQIRVQASSRGHPIVGDVKYGSSPSKRLALHAYKLTFTHPITKKKLSFDSPLPLILKK